MAENASETQPLTETDYNDLFDTCINFESYANLEGTVMYMCCACGSVCDGDDSVTHAMGVHDATHISILYIPITTETTQESDNNHDEGKDNE